MKLVIIYHPCPPCPNEILERWEQENPQQYKEYNDAENLSVELSETTAGSVFGSRICPLCRKKYERV